MLRITTVISLFCVSKVVPKLVGVADGEIENEKIGVGTTVEDVVSTNLAGVMDHTVHSLEIVRTGNIANYSRTHAVENL